MQLQKNTLVIARQKASPGCLLKYGIFLKKLIGLTNQLKSGRRREKSFALSYERIPIRLSMIWDYAIGSKMIRMKT